MFSLLCNLPQGLIHFFPSFLLSVLPPYPAIPLSPLMAQSPIPLLDDSHNNAENSSGSPSDFHSSVETSPAIVPLSETPFSDGGHFPSSSLVCPPPYRHRKSFQRSSVSTAGRGGCWCVFVLPTCLTRAPVCTFSFSSFVPHQDLPSQTKSTSSVCASLRPPHHMVDATWQLTGPLFSLRVPGLTPSAI